MDKVSLEEAKEQVKKVCERLALLHLSFAETLVEEFGQEKGKKLVLKAIRNYGIRIGEEVKSKVENNDPQNYEGDLPLYGMHEKHEEIEVNGETRIRAHGCVMGKLWNELNENKLGGLYCFVDPAKYMAFNPDYKLIHTKSIPNGDEYCEFIIRPCSEQEKKDFRENNDWSYVDDKIN